MWWNSLEEPWWGASNEYPHFYGEIRKKSVWLPNLYDNYGIQNNKMLIRLYGCIYSWLSLSRTRLSRITTYLEVKILSLPKHENLTTSKKYCGKEEKLLLRSNFSSFPQYFRYISNVKSPITYKFVKYGCLNYFFLKSENLICQGTDISKCFRESLGIRDNESRLYIYLGLFLLYLIKIISFHLAQPLFL